jgi:hypothetical protein
MIAGHDVCKQMDSLQTLASVIWSGGVYTVPRKAGRKSISSLAAHRPCPRAGATVNSPKHMSLPARPPICPSYTSHLPVMDAMNSRDEAMNTRTPRIRPRLTCDVLDPI